MTLEALQKQLARIKQHDLPGIISHQKLAPTTRQINPEKLPNVSEYRNAAVGIILHHWKNELSFVLIQRPVYNGNHSGQIAFPGGKVEKYDADFCAAAIRETEEEIGIQLEQHHYVNALTEVYVPVSKYIVHPFLFVYESPVSFKIDPIEVDSAFSIPVLELLDEKNLKSMDMTIYSDKRTLKDVPYFDLSGRVVWGATALILSELKDVLLS